MGNIQALTRKKVRIGIKNGWSIETFCQEYGCDEETLEKRIVGLYKYNKSVDEVFSKLNDNGKKLERHKRQLKSRKGVPGPCASGLVLVSDEENQEASPEAIDSLPFEEDATANCATTDLDRLRSEERKLSEEIIALELQHKAEAKKRRECLNQLRAAKAEIEKMEAELKAKCAEYDGIIVEANALAESMNTISAQRRPQVEQLLEVRKEIVRMESVTIAVYDSGEITLLEGIDFSLDDSGHEELYAQLLEREECSELRLKDIRVLARLLSVVEHSDRRITPICDRPEVEEVFLKLKG